MLTNNAQNKPFITDDSGEARKPAAMSITLRNQTVDVNKLEPNKKSQLIDFLTQSYNHNIQSIQQSSTSKEALHSSDYDTLIQLLTHELNSHDMSEGGKSKLIYLLHNRVEQQDEIINKNALKQQSIKPSTKQSAKPSTKKNVKANPNSGKIKAKKPIDVFSAGNENNSVLMNDVVTESETQHNANGSFEKKGLTSKLSLQAKNTLSPTVLPVLKRSELKQPVSNSNKFVKSQPLTQAVAKNPAAINQEVSLEQALKSVSKKHAMGFTEQQSIAGLQDSEFEHLNNSFVGHSHIDEEDDDDDEADTEQQFELKDHFKTHSQSQWPTSSNELIIEVLHLNNGQVKNVSYLQKGQSFKVEVAGKKHIIAKNKGNGRCHYHFNGEHFKGEIRQRGGSQLSVNSLNTHDKQKPKQIPEQSDVCIRMGSDTYVLRVNLPIASPKVKVEETNLKTAYKSVATSTAFHVLVMVILAIVFSFNKSPIKEKEPTFVKMELPKEQAIIKKEKPKPKPKAVVKPKPKPVVKAKTKPKPKAPVKVKAKTKVKPKIKPKTKATQKPRKKVVKKPVVGNGQKGNIKKRDVKKSGLLSMLGSSKKTPKRNMAQLTSLDAVSSSSSSAKLKVSGLKANLKGSRMTLPTGELINAGGAANALRSGGVGNKGSVAALNRNGTGTQAVTAMVSANMSRSVKIKGGLTRDQVKRVIDSNMDDVTYCYETALMSSPSLGGKIVFEWKVKSAGNVGAVNIKSSNVKSDEIHSCIKSAIKGWKFPQPSGGSAVFVSYPFIFDTVGF